MIISSAGFHAAQPSPLCFWVVTVMAQLMKYQDFDWRCLWFPSFQMKIDWNTYSTQKDKTLVGTCITRQLMGIITFSHLLKLKCERHNSARCLHLSTIYDLIVEFNKCLFVGPHHLI